MEQILNNGIYTIDLSEENTAPEVIFKLSDYLEKDDVKNKRICLKFSNVYLNQAQLLSIKSLINGINSTLAGIDTKSEETEKVALSLGIIVSNSLIQNQMEVSDTMPYKSVQTYIEEQTNENKTEEIINQTVNETDEVRDEVVCEPEQQAVNTEADEIKLDVPSREEIKDELDVIFNSSTVRSEIFQTDTIQYAEKEAMDDIIVPEEEFTKEDFELESFPTKYIKQTIRSGQVINYDGNIVIIGDCHPGSEITAFGDITVWGVLSGIAHAGAGGNQKARVRALKMNAIQLRIANCYSRRPDSLNTVYIEKTDSFTPEEARIINGEIVVFKIND